MDTPTKRNKAKQNHTTKHEAIYAMIKISNMQNFT